MAPSIAELPVRTEPAPVTVPVKAIPGTTATPEKLEGKAEVKPRIRRIIEEEGGDTTASVCFTYLDTLRIYEQRLRKL